MHAPIKQLWQEKIRFFTSRGCPADEATAYIQQKYPKLQRAILKEYRAQRATKKV